MVPDSAAAIEEILREARSREDRARRRAVILTVVPVLLAAALLATTARTVARARAEVREAVDSVRVLKSQLAAARDSVALLDTIKVRLDTLIQLNRATLDSLDQRIADVTTKLTTAQASLAAAARELDSYSSGRDPSAQSAAQEAFRRASSAVDQLQSAVKQTSQARDTLKIIQAEVAYTGTLSPGSPVNATIRLPYRASLSYRRWISRQKSDTLGTFDAGEIHLKLPYGGYLYFEARNLADGQIALRPVDCTHGCAISFE